MASSISQDTQDLIALLDGSVQYSDNKAQVIDPNRLAKVIHRLAEVSALGSGTRQGLARFLVRQIALSAGVIPASINELYMARGRGEVPFTFTVPAVNLRALSFEAARAVFRTAHALDAGAFIFEIARSEMGYTDQRPAEYVTSILAAALAEGYRGPVFIQGDHFQVSAKRYATEPEKELQAVRDVTREAIAAGFFNIDIDTSTLVDITKSDLNEQQALNTRLSAMYTALVRELEPEGVTISIGGEIGEVGTENSTEPELRAYMDGYNTELARIAPDACGLSKISIQTGTSHGGVVLPDGSIQEVAVDFETLRLLSRISRQDYQMGGAVQHGASTLPQSAFSKFVEAEAIEVHLATGFQTIFFVHLPEDLRGEMYAWLDQNNAADRKANMTDEQFYYKMRKNAIGPFKQQAWNLSPEVKAEIGQAWEDQFRLLFTALGLQGTRTWIEQTITATPVVPDRAFYLGEKAAEEDVSDLAD